MKNQISLFLDSGAFSAFTKGINIDIQAYISFIKEHKEYIDIYANLDVIGDAEKSLENQKIMEEAGLSPIPCFHLNEDFSYLKYYVENYGYIALGGIAQAGPAAQPWMDQCFEMFCDNKGYPKCKVHGFAVTSLRLMLRYPWFSVDSTSWVMTSRMGFIYIPRYKNGQWVYDENSWKACVSSRSPSKSDDGKHIDTFPQNAKEHIIEYLAMKGYNLGSSEFKMAMAKKYQLEENEKWNGKENPDGTREVEIIIEDGLCNNYKLRDEVNIIYFLDLEKTMPEWPWPFKQKGVQRFEM